MSTRPTICVDFDGVIHDPSTGVGKSMGQPITGAKTALELLSQDYRVVVLTTRGGNPEHVEDWLDYYQIPYARVTNIKPDAVAYIDDKGIRFRDWASTLAELGVSVVTAGYSVAEDPEAYVAMISHDAARQHPISTSAIGVPINHEPLKFGKDLQPKAKEVTPQSPWGDRR